MTTLRTKIIDTTTETQLINVVKSMPKQDNGFPTKLQRILENCFWYYDLQTLESKKNWILKRI